MTTTLYYIPRLMTGSVASIQTGFPRRFSDLPLQSIGDSHMALALRRWPHKAPYATYDSDGFFQCRSAVTCRGTDTVYVDI